MKTTAIIPMNTYDGIKEILNEDGELIGNYDISHIVGIYNAFKYYDLDYWEVREISGEIGSYIKKKEILKREKKEIEETVRKWRNLSRRVWSHSRTISSMENRLISKEFELKDQESSIEQQIYKNKKIEEENIIERKNIWIVVAIAILSNLLTVLYFLNR